MQGDAVTKGLRKVTDDMKTKNRPDRTGIVSHPVGNAAESHSKPTLLEPLGKKAFFSKGRGSHLFRSKKYSHSGKTM